MPWVIPDKDRAGVYLMLSACTLCEGVYEAVQQSVQEPSAANNKNLLATVRNGLKNCVVFNRNTPKDRVGVVVWLQV